ncbi:hypothetical protein FJ251_09075 [bacterium]|nr:hypothetical protein [bacterium]
MPSLARALAASLLLAALGCRPASAPGLDPEQLSLLRLEYLERAERLPALRFDQVELPAAERFGSFSPLRWELRAPALPLQEALRPLPYADPGPRLRESLARVLQDFGFETGGISRRRALRLLVSVERIVLLTEADGQERRSCELQLLLRIAEEPSGLELRRYRSRGRSELPGSWLALREGHAQWSPHPGEPDPLTAAAALAAQDFLAESLDFWRRPANWEQGAVNLTALPAAGQSR